MHRGTGIAATMMVLLIGAVGVWMVMGPLFTASYAFTMRNARTGQHVACRASFAPGFSSTQDPRQAAATCETSCRDRNFVTEGAGAGLAIDYVSLAAYRRVQHRYWAYIPAACRPDA